MSIHPVPPGCFQKRKKEKKTNLFVFVFFFLSLLMAVKGTANTTMTRAAEPFRVRGATIRSSLSTPRPIWKPGPSAASLSRPICLLCWGKRKRKEKKGKKPKTKKTKNTKNERKNKK
jgi:hypothetical protein